MNSVIRHDRLALVALVGGALAGLGAYSSTPIFGAYVASVMSVIETAVPAVGGSPGLGLSLLIALLVGVSMNFLPCNVPIVMTLLPAASGARSRGRALQRTGLFAIGAVAVLGALGFVLGLAGSALEPLVMGYPTIGVNVAGAILGTIGLLSVGWGLRELGILDVPQLSVPLIGRLRRWVDRRSGPAEFLLLGAVYGGSGGGCPMPTYHLLLVWIVVAADPVYGALLLGTYVVGRVLPVAGVGLGLAGRSSRAGELFGGRYASLRRVNGVVLVGFGSLLVVFAGLRALAGGA